MQAYRVETTVEHDGQVTVRNVPLQAGDVVDVIIVLRYPHVVLRQPYPFRNIPIIYSKPFEPVALSDWEIIQ